MGSDEQPRAAAVRDVELTRWGQPAYADAEVGQLEAQDAGAEDKVRVQMLEWGRLRCGDGGVHGGYFAGTWSSGVRDILVGVG